MTNKIRINEGLGKSHSTALMLYNQIINAKGGEKLAIVTGNKIIEISINIKEKLHGMTAEEIDKFNNMKDEDIDCSDIPELDDDFWDNAKIVKNQDE